LRNKPFGVFFKKNKKIFQLKINCLETILKNFMIKILLRNSIA